LAVRIRLTRVGATKRPSYRVVAIDSRRPRDGRSLEILGYYDPLTDPATVQIDADRLNAWIAKGARPSDTVGRLMRQAGMASAPALPEFAVKAKPKPEAKPARSRKAPAKATTAKAAAEPAAAEAPTAVADAVEEPEAVADTAGESAAEEPTPAADDAAAEEPAPAADDAAAEEAKSDG
jgi:small subunit ribosomal protein S16